jgi:hypothetical protein
LPRTTPETAPSSNMADKNLPGRPINDTRPF